MGEPAVGSPDVLDELCHVPLRTGGYVGFEVRRGGSSELGSIGLDVLEVYGGVHTQESASRLPSVARTERARRWLAYADGRSVGPVDARTEQPA